VASPPLAHVDLARGLEAALEQVPASAGVGQLLASDGRNLLLGPAANLRRWAASHLGLGAKPAPGRRPRTNLAGVAAAIAYVRTRGAFHQRLVFERLMAPLVPLRERRDLKPPAFLRIDVGLRFPRAVVSGSEDGAFGPFRDRGAADRARDAVQRLFRLRPCDALFEPAPDLALGLSCLYAQVRSCAAPCLVRIGEADYRSLASSAAAWLADPASRDDAPAAVPPTVGSAASGRALVLDSGRGEIGLFPVVGGCVLDARARWAPPADLAAALGDVDWSAPGPASAADWPWLTSWLQAPRARAAWLLVQQDESVASLSARAFLALQRPEPGASRTR
jgi:hypothetical protein